MRAFSHFHPLTAIRPVSRTLSDALYMHVQTLEGILRSLIDSDQSQREKTIADLKMSSIPLSSTLGMSGPSSLDRDLEKCYAKINGAAGQHDFKYGTAENTRFFGNMNKLWDTDNDVMHESVSMSIDEPHKVSPSLAPRHVSIHLDTDVLSHLLSLFFSVVYPESHMYLYREFFLRDFRLRKGPYYSELLLVSICSVAAKLSPNAEVRAMSDALSAHAQTILFEESLNTPDIKVLQSLLLLGHRETAENNLSKGWMFSGMYMAVVDVAEFKSRHGI